MGGGKARLALPPTRPVGVARRLWQLNFLHVPPVHCVSFCLLPDTHKVEEGGSLNIRGLYM